MVNGFNSINYWALKLSGNKQLGSNQAAKDGELNLKDGLSLEELSLLDWNMDGSISEDEFKHSFGGDGDEYKETWNEYTAFYSLSSKKTDSGYTNTTKVDGKKIVTTLDKDGNMIGYREITTSANGVTTEVKYSNKDGANTLKTTTKKYLDGSYEIKNEENGNLTKKTPDKTTVVLDQNNKLKKVATPDGNNSVSFSYDKNGKISGATVIVDGKKVKGSKVAFSKDGKTIYVTDEKGNNIAKYKTLEDGNVRVTQYKNGNIYKNYTLNENMEATKITTYATSGSLKGKLIGSTDTKDGSYKEFQYDSKGNRISSIQYDAEGKKVSKLIYSTEKPEDYYANNSNALWKAQIKYDKNGNVESYTEFEYETNEDKTRVVQHRKTYTDESKKTLVSTLDVIQDGYGNKTRTVKTDAQGNVTTSTYTYAPKKITSKLTNEDLVSVVTTAGNKITTSYYTNGKVSKKQVQVIDSGVATTTTFEYAYYERTNKMRQMIKILPDGAKLYFYYDAEGKLIK